MSKLLSYLAFAADPQSLRSLLKQMKRTLTEPKGPSATALIGSKNSGKNFVANVWLMMLDPKGPSRENGIANFDCSDMTDPWWLSFLMDKKIVFLRRGDQPLQGPHMVSMLRSMMSSDPFLIDRQGLPPITAVISPHLIFVQESASIQVPCVKVYLREDPEAKSLYDQLNESKIDHLAELEHLRQAVMAS